MKHISSILLFGVVSLHSPMFAATEAPKHHRAFQPPGLYQRDWEAQAVINDNGKPAVLEGKVDGASGDASNRFRSGATMKEVGQKGQKPNTQCVYAGTPAAQAALKASCPDHTVLSVDLNTLSYVSNCPTAHSTRTVKRIDDKTWETATTIKLKGETAKMFPVQTVRERWRWISDTCK